MQATVQDYRLSRSVITGIDDLVAVQSASTEYYLGLLPGAWE